LKILSSEQIGFGIIGVGSSLPDKILTNFDLEKMVETSDEWITQRTGISERRVLDKETPAYSLGVEAAQRALEDAGISAEELDLIIAATAAPDYNTPSTACIIQGEIGAKNAAAFDINAACAGFVYGLTIAEQFLKTGYYKKVLIVGIEGMSKVTDWEDRNTCVLFGDGAGAVILGQVEKGFGLLATHIGADGSSWNTITIPSNYLSEDDFSKRAHENKRVLWMDGSEVFKFAIKVLVQASEKVIKDAGLTLDEVKLIVPHQANIRIIDGAIKRLKVPADRVFVNVHKYGNISAASIPVALDEISKSGALTKGDNLVFVGFGGGLTWASALVKWAK
jgi:3-oxoacyl-[acyl-carrier-protein] synthase III